MTTKTSPALKGNLGLVGVPLWVFKRHLPGIFTDHVISSRFNEFITMNSGFGCGLLKVCRWLEMVDLESHMKWCDFTYLLGTWTIVIRATFSWLRIKWSDSIIISLSAQLVQGKCWVSWCSRGQLSHFVILSKAENEAIHLRTWQPATES